MPPPRRPHHRATSGSVADLLIDTDVFIDHLRGAAALKPGRHRLHYSVVTRAELFAGNTAINLSSQILAPFRELNVDRVVADALAGSHASSVSAFPTPSSPRLQSSTSSASSRETTSTLARSGDYDSVHSDRSRRRAASLKECELSTGSFEGAARVSRCRRRCGGASSERCRSRHRVNMGVLGPAGAWFASWSSARNPDGATPSDPRGAEALLLHRIRSVPSCPSSAARN